MINGRFMTVKELIEELSELDPNLMVAGVCLEECDFGIRRVEVAEVKMGRYNGELGYRIPGESVFCETKEGTKVAVLIGDCADIR